MHGILVGHKPVDTAAQNIGLIACLFVERNKAIFDSAFARKAFFEDTNAIIWDNF
jgi:hypothetical protein